MATGVPFADNRGPSSQNRCLGVTTDHPCSAGCNEQWGAKVNVHSRRCGREPLMGLNR
jgi:hypothetical protein